MIHTDIFTALEVGDVFYRGTARYTIESIEHRTTVKQQPWGAQTIAEARARTAYKQTRNRRIEIGFVTFLNLSPWTIDKVVKKNKVRGTRDYKSRRDYPFVLTIDNSPLETSENNDCTVRSLSIMLEIPYDDAHAFMKAKGRKHGKGFASSLAYGHKGLRFVHNVNGLTFGGLLKSGLLPARAIIRTRKHVVAVINGVVHDTFRTGKNSKVTGWYINV